MPRTLRVRYYAQLREALRADREDVEVEALCDERGLLELLAARHPRQRDLLLASRVAVADAYAPAGPLAESPDGGVDIISPISGG